MVFIDSGFVVPTISEDERYEGTNVDAAVLRALPEGSSIKWMSTCGVSFWALRNKIDTVQPDGREVSYFLKVYNADKALEIAQGEFESTQELVSVVPDNIPRPVGYGVCADDPKRAFFLAEFCDLTDKLPSVSEFVSIVAKIHQKTPPTGKFGYHIRTFSGKHPTDTSWCDTWETFFTRSMKDTMEAEMAVQGPHPEMANLSEKILTKVIPRLIRPMEAGGRKITPVLVHGDLWHGNVSVDNETKNPVIYDPCCFYAHNEYEFSMWRASRYLTNRAHVDAYFKIAEVSEPAEDQDGRQALYALRADLAVSILWPDNKRIRELAIEEMRRLVSKYGAGYEGYMVAKYK